jgi:hypothetical protein
MCRNVQSRTVQGYYLTFITGTKHRTRAGLIGISSSSFSSNSFYFPSHKPLLSSPWFVGVCHCFSLPHSVRSMLWFFGVVIPCNLVAGCQHYARTVVLLADEWIRVTAEHLTSRSGQYVCKNTFLRHVMQCSWLAGTDVLEATGAFQAQ